MAWWGKGEGEKGHRRGVVMAGGGRGQAGRCVRVAGRHEVAQAGRQRRGGRQAGRQARGDYSG